MVISINGVLVNVFGPITVTEGIIILVKEQFSKEPLFDDRTEIFIKSAILANHSSIIYIKKLMIYYLS